MTHNVCSTAGLLKRVCTRYMPTAFANFCEIAKICNVVCDTEVPSKPNHKQSIGTTRDTLFLQQCNKCLLSGLTGCKPTLHVPVEQKHNGETLGIVREVVPILVVRIPSQANRALNLCRCYWDIYQELGCFCQNTALFISK